MELVFAFLSAWSVCPSVPRVLEDRQNSDEVQVEDEPSRSCGRGFAVAGRRLGESL